MSHTTQGGTKVPIPKTTAAGTKASAPQTNSIGAGALASQADSTQGGTKVPIPKTTAAGTGALASQTSSIGTVALASQTDSTQGRTKAPTPKKTYKHLSHIDIPDTYQFVTFRTFDSIDTYIQKIALSNKPNKIKQIEIDNYLDNSSHGAYLKDEVLQWLFDFLLHQDTKIYKLVAFVIMHNHVHILFKPLIDLSKVMQKIKGLSAKEINKILGKKGRFWANDYYDKAIRDERHFWVVYRYIKNNPLKVCGTKVPIPKAATTKASSPQTNSTAGTGALASKTNSIGTKASSPQTNSAGTGALASQTDSIQGGTKVPIPKAIATVAAAPQTNSAGTGALASPKVLYTTFPRFYGIYEE